MHKAIRLTESLHNKPHLITQDSFENILSYLSDRNALKIDFSSPSQKIEPAVIPAFDGYNPDTKIGVLQLDGPLSYRPTGMEALCGGASYTDLIEQMEQFVSLGAEKVVMDLSTPGGEAYACFESAEYVRQLADENNIELIGYVDGQAASAGYGWAVVCHTLISNPDSSIGSIGVVVKLMNDSKALEKEGIERVFVYAGDNKVPYADDGSFRKEFIDDIQADVNDLYLDFVNHVSKWMEIPEVEVKNTQAKSFRAKEALKLGLIDKVMTRQQFASFLAGDDEEEWEDSINNIINPEDDKQEKAMPIGSIFKRGAANKAEAKTEEKVDLNMAVDEKVFAEMTAQMAEMQATMNANAEAMKAAMAMVEQYKAQASALEAEKQLAADNARKATLTAVIGTAKLDSVFTATRGLDEAQFNAVVDAMKLSREEESKGVMFAEVGTSGEAEPKKVEMSDLDKQSKLMQDLIAKRNAQ